VRSPRTKNPLDGNKSRIPYSEGSFPHKHNFLKFKHENVIQMKNKHDPALLRPSNLSNEIKRVTKSRETIPLSSIAESHHVDGAPNPAQSTTFDAVRLLHYRTVYQANF
jgi:hypothetical protein